LFFSLLLGIIASIAILPSYSISTSKEKDVTTHLAQLKASLEERSGGDLGLLLNDAKAKISLINTTNKTKAATSQIIRDLLEAKPSGIAITGILYSEDDKGVRQILVTGTSLNRESLVGFSQNVKKLDEFEGVNLPVSNFAKDSDIDFSMQITLPQK